MLLLSIVFLFTSCGNKKEEVKPLKQMDVSLKEIDSISHSGIVFLKQDSLINYIASAKYVTPNIKLKAPFDTLQYNKVIGYNFEGSEEPYSSIIMEGKFVPVVVSQQYLTQQQVDNIIKILTNITTYGGVTAACFQPHFALVFYNNDLPVKKIDICLECNYLFADIEIEETKHFKMNKGKENEYYLNGFSKKGKAAIQNLINNLNP